MNPRRTRAASAGVVLGLALWASVVAPWSQGASHLRVPRDRELDGIQETLLVGDRIERLLASPRSYYDTAILYPDRHQLRSTEPFLGFALLGVPLRTLVGLDDVALFETLRWGFVVAAAGYAYLILRAIGVDRATAMAGGLVSVSQPDLLNGIERLQIVSLPLILGVVYHGMRAWTSGRRAHRAGLFVVAALYPLCGMVNVTFVAMAGVFVLPTLLGLAARSGARARLMMCAGPLVCAAAVDTVLLAPWLGDRTDLAVYVSDAFLAIKHWSPAPAPGRPGEWPEFAAARLGLGLVAALAVSWLLAAWPTRVGTGQDASRPDGRGLAPASPGQRYLVVVCAAAAARSWAARVPAGPVVSAWLGPLFQLACWCTLFWSWAVQWRARGHAAGQPETNLARTAAALAAGAGVLVCLMAFGPVAPTNDSPLATDIMRVLLHVVPPLRSVREFHRIWILGVLFLSVSATASLGARLRGRSPMLRAGVALVLALAALVSVLRRDALAVVDVTPPAGLVALATRAPHPGPIYVHPQMEWNTMPGVWMIPAARALRQPIVNGYLGIAPPWFIYAGRVLGRFPAPEAVWLLRHWRVTTVVSVVGDVGAQDSPFVTKVFEDPRGAVYDIATAEGALAHPSGGRCLPSDGGVRVAASFVAERGDGGTTLAVTGPGGLATSALEVAFRPSVIEDMPTAMLVYPVRGDGDAPLGGLAREEAPLNAGPSGGWIESLAADALLLRQSPVATVHLGAPTQAPLRMLLRDTSSPPVERITLCGDWAR